MSYRVLFLLLCCGVCVCQAQQPEESTTDSKTEIGVSPAGAQRFSRGGWAAIAVNGINNTDQDTEETVSVFVGDDPSVQYSTDIWIPANGRRTTWLPIRVPEGFSTAKQSAPLSWMRLRKTSTGEAIAHNEVGMSISQRSLLLTDDEKNTAILFDRRPLNDNGDWFADQEKVYEAVYAARDRIVTSLVDLGLVDLNASFLPSTYEALSELDHIILASDRITEDTGGLDQLRSWIAAGGRLWIMLDRVSQETVEELLGDAAKLHVVDQTELTEFEIVTVPRGADAEIIESWESDTPVSFKRVITEMEVTSSIGQWPAVMWHSFGQGEVMFTTLGYRGWLDVRDQPTGAYYRSSVRLYQNQDVQPDHSQALVPMLQDSVGYSVPNRSIAALVLGLNLAVILVLGCLWAAQRKLERMAILIPVSTLVATAIMLWIGHRQVTAVPSTVATGQIVQVHDSLSQAHVSTVQAVYSQGEGELGLVTDASSITLPDTPDAAGQLRRLHRDKQGTTRWVGLKQPPGVLRYMTSQRDVYFEKQICVRGAFDARGFVGSVYGVPQNDFGDPILIAGPRPVTAVKTDSELESDQGGFTVRFGQDDLLASDQFVDSAILTDRQRKRQEALRQILSNAETSPFPATPTVLAWTSPTMTGNAYDKRFTDQGTALIAFPVQLTRPVDETEYFIPATFVGMGTDGKSPVYNPRTGKWLPELTKPADCVISCQFPRELLPLKLKSLSINIKLNAPSRSLIVNSMAGTSPKEIYRIDDPAGNVRFTCDQPEQIALDADAALKLQFQITGVDGQSETDAFVVDAPNASRRPQSTIKSTWQIDHMFVDAVGISETSNP